MSRFIVGKLEWLNLGSNSAFGKLRIYIWFLLWYHNSSPWKFESRCYRWFYIREGDKLTCVYRDDGRKTVKVTEDVTTLKNDHVKKMKEYGWLSECE